MLVFVYTTVSVRGQARLNVMRLSNFGYSDPWNMDLKLLQFWNFLYIICNGEQCECIRNGGDQTSIITCRHAFHFYFI